MSNFYKKLTFKIREFLRFYFQKSPSVYRFIKKIYRIFVPIQNRTDYQTIQSEIENQLNGNDTLFFVQIGSNDGKQGDPLHNMIKSNFKWSGIFIEPVKFIFDRLVKNYRNEKRFTFENVAIAETKGKTKFYYLHEMAETEIKGGLPWWHDQLGSFDKEHIQKHFDQDIEPYIIEEEINCLPINEVLERNGVSNLDLLHIDTEGYDYKILSQFNFKKYNPTCILYEGHHLSNSEKEGAQKLLKTFGYKLKTYGIDVLAILEN